MAVCRRKKRNPATRRSRPGAARRSGLTRREQHRRSHAGWRLRDEFRGPATQFRRLNCRNRRRVRQPAARMRQPIEKVRRQVTPETFCSPPSRARSCAATSQIVAPRIAAPTWASIVQPKVISCGASASNKLRSIKRSGARSQNQRPESKPHQPPNETLARTCEKLIARQLRQRVVRAPRTMA